MARHEVHMRGGFGQGFGISFGCLLGIGAFFATGFVAMCLLCAGCIHLGTRVADHTGETVRKTEEERAAKKDAQAAMKDLEINPFDPDEVVEILPTTLPAMMFKDARLLIDWSIANLSNKRDEEETIKAKGFPIFLLPKTKVMIVNSDGISTLVKVVGGPQNGETGFIMSVCIGWRERVEAKKRGERPKPSTPKTDAVVPPNPKPKDTPVPSPQPAPTPVPSVPPLPSVALPWSSSWETIGQVMVRIKEAKTGPAPLSDDSGRITESTSPALLFTIEAKNVSKTMRRDYRFWSPAPDFCELSYGPRDFIPAPKFPVGLSLAQRTERYAELKPSGFSAEQLLAFDIPRQNAKHVILTLNASKVDEKGSFVFKIPGSVWQSQSGGPKK